MGFFESFYFNYYFIGFLIAAVFGFLVSYFLLSIKDKSKATKHLGISLAALGGVSLAYAIPSGFYYEFFAYHNWIVVPLFLLVFTHTAQFFFHFPSTIDGKVSRYILFGQYSVIILFTLYYIVSTAGMKPAFNFSDHFWDFNAQGPNSYFGYMLLLYVVVYTAVGVWKIAVHKHEKRYVVLTLLGVLLVTNLVPAILNSLSRDGAVDRSLYLTLLSLFIVIGYFFVFVIYLNHSRDQTSFMVKIISTSIVTALSFLLLLSAISINEIENAYDSIHNERTSRILQPDGPRKKDLRYIVRYSEYDRVVKSEFRTNKSVIEWPPLHSEFLNTLMHARISAIKGNGYRFVDSLTRTLHRTAKANPQFAGYRELVYQFIGDKDPEDLNAKTVITYVDGMRRFLLYRSNQIRKLPEEKFRKKLTSFLKSQPDEFAPFVHVLNNHLNSSVSLGTALKGEILDHLAPVHPATFRKYRAHVNEADHYISYSQVDLENGWVYEVGYSYSKYRSFLHATPFRLTILLIFFVLVILVGFRFFFFNSLIKPLNALLDGLREVRKGNIELSLPVQVEDEIGFLSRSFNEMVEAIRDARKRLQEYADKLEDRVKERTRELRETLEKVQKLKLQQDGDYFLTSLLQKPLCANYSHETHVKIDFLVKQKKTFSFRKWDEEIGGDMCVAHDLTLKGQKCTVFLNADAMGKSIQGAGGTLVLGAVFNSIVERTKSTKGAEAIFPELWLYETMRELQKVFESFEGSMLISLALGVVEADTGVMYYINAEHPWSILYRDNHADFIETELSLRKLGTPDVERELSVRVMQLKPNDVLIAGSDGRDDILIPVGNGQEVENRVINEDENLFLTIVEGGEGELDKIYDSLNEHGEQTDDLSLLRLEYTGKTHEFESLAPEDEELLVRARSNGAVADAGLLLDLGGAQERSPDHKELQKTLIKFQAQAGDFKEAASMAEDFTRRHPADTKMVYNTALYYSKLKNFKMAREYAERVSVREPDFIPNRILLSQVYFNLRELDLAMESIESVLKVDKDNEKARKIVGIIEDKLEEHRAFETAPAD